MQATTMDTTADLFGAPIHVYTRAQAIADGALIDVNATAREASLVWPVAMTAAAWNDCVVWDEATEARKGYGILADAAAGGINGNGQAALIGGLVGGVADTVVGGLVKDVTVTVDSEIQIGVRQAQAVQTAQNATLQQGDSTVETQKVVSVSDVVDYRVKVITTADQTNLKLTDAIPQMNRGLIRNVVGLF